MKRLTNKELQKIQVMILEKHRIYIFTNEEYEVHHEPFKNQTWKACSYINNIIYKPDLIGSNNNILYYWVHELTHNILHNQKRRFGYEYLCINEIQAETVARIVMETLDLRYTKAKVKVLSEKKIKDLEDRVDKRGYIDYLEYWNYEMYGENGTFTNVEIDRNLNRDLLIKYVEAFVTEIKECLD